MEDISNFIDAPIIGKTIQDINDGNSTALVLPNEFVKELKIENSRVAISLIKDLDENKHILISKLHREILIEGK